VYDGNTNATFSGTATLSGSIVAGDVVTLSGSGTANFIDANASNGILIVTSGYTLSGADASRYLITQPGLSADITKAPLTIGAASIASKVYDQSASSGAVTPGSITGGLVGLQTVTVSATGLYANALAANGKTATITYTLGDGTFGGLAANYSLANGTATGNITKKGLTISGITVTSKVYDGNNTSTLGGTATLVGVLAPDVVTIGAGSATYNTVDVGTGIALTASGYTLGGADAGNYSLTQPSGLTGDITKKH